MDVLQKDLQTFFGFITLAYDCLVWAATSFVNYAVHAVGEGLKLLGQIVNGMATAIVQAAQKMVDAFNAFVTWAVTFIRDTVNSVLGAVSDSMWSLLNGQYLSMQQFSASAQGDIHGPNGSVSEGTKASLSDLIFGDFFWLLVGIATLASVAWLLLNGLTLGFGFLATFAVTMIVGVLLKEAVNYVSSASGTNPTDYGKSAIMDELNAMLGSSQNETVSDGADVFEACFGIFTFIPEMAMFAVLKEKLTFALTLSITLLAFMNLVTKDPIISVTTLGVSLICLAKLYHDQDDLFEITKDKTLIKFGQFSALSGIGASSICLFL